MTERMTTKQYRKSRLKSVTEAEVQREIRQYLKSTSRPYCLTDATKALNVHGQQVQRVTQFWPDLTTITDGARMFCIEVKKPVGGVLSRGQALRLRQLHEAGVLICIARSVEDVKATEALGTARMDDLEEIARTLRKPIKSDYKNKPIDESVGF